MAYSRAREIRENEAISFDDFAHRDIDRLPKAGAIVHKRMEFAVFATGVNRGRQIGEESVVWNAPDGMIGLGTRQALRAWQKDQHLPADGYLSPEVLARLKAAAKT